MVKLPKKPLKKTEVSVRRVPKSPKKTILSSHPFPYHVIFLALIPLIVTWIVFSGVTKNGFTNWDDPTYVLENRKIIEFDNEAAVWFFRNPSASNYHPLTMISLGLDSRNAKKTQVPVSSSMEPDAVPFHSTSLVLYLITVLLVFIFVYLLTDKRWIPALIVALLFGVHPFHVESVAWISERKDVLYGMFFMAGLILYVRYLQIQRGYLLWITFGLFFLSVLSKPAAIVFPVIMLVMDYFTHRKFTMRLWLEKLPFIAVSIAAGLITFLIQSKDAVADFKTFTILQRFLFATYGFVIYLVKALVPLKMSAFYPYPNTTLSGNLPLQYYLLPLVVVALAVLVFLSLRNTRFIAFVFLFYSVNLLLVLQFISVGSAIMADRYAYIPSLAIFLLIGIYSDKLFRKWGVRSIWTWIVTVIISIWIIFLGFISVRQIRVWKDTETLWTDVISKYPNVEVAYKNRGNFYGKLNRMDEALRDYQALIQLHTKDAKVYSNLGNIYALRGETEKALESYGQSIRMDSLSYEAYMNRGITYARIRNFNAALSDMNKALKLSPSNTEIQTNRAYLLLDMGHYTEALEAYTLLQREFPGNDDLYMRRGIAYFNLKDFPAAIQDLTHCLNLNPRNGFAWYQLSLAHRNFRQFRDALLEARKAKELGVSVPESYIQELQVSGK
jgi:Flp pilus assembly protein TadD